MKHKTDWNLGLMYSSPSDPKIEKDVKILETTIEVFCKKYSKNSKYLNNPSQLLIALNEYEKIDALPYPLAYFYLYLDVVGGNKIAEAAKNRISLRLTQAGNKILFFKLSIAKIPKSQQKKFLNDNKLSNYRYFLENIFKRSKHYLSENEEKILSLKNLTSRELWISGQENILGKLLINFAGKEIPISEAVGKVKHLPTKERQILHNQIMEKYKSVSDFAESEMNAVVIDKKINDELRGYEKPYSATILNYQNVEKEIELLVATTTKQFSVAHRFYKLKSQMHNLPKLAYADRSAVVGKNSKKIPFNEGVSIIRSAFSKLGNEYASILDKYLLNGQIDVFPKVGKKSGAYCWTNVNLPTYVLMNYTEDLSSISTLAHEMGHAIHGELSKGQSVIYQGHTISVAEVASTLFENFVFEEVFKSLSEEEKIIALHDHILDDVQTIFRQIALFNFEVEMHKTIREKGSMSKEEIATMMNKHMKSYLGPLFEMSDVDGYNFVSWSHIRNFFYVYAYAYGQIISKALYKKYQEDPNYMRKIELFLKAGESKSPEDIFKAIGIDTSKPAFFEAGLESIKQDIIKLEKLIRKTKIKH